MMVNALNYVQKLMQFFHFYGITNRENIRYIYSTFSLVEQNEKAKFHGGFRSRNT